MLSGRRRPRGGNSAVEMLIVIVVSAIAIGGVGALGFRQQRFHRDVVAVAERLEQLGQTTALVPVAIRSIAPAENDIPSGGARDTSLTFRALIATAVVCDSAHGSMVLAPAHSTAPWLASFLQRPESGDTVWALTTTPTAESWVPRAITGVVDSTANCFLGGMSPWVGPASGASVVLRIAGTGSAGQGVPVRITRAWKYSLYRASDGGWYLGAREWNAATLRFNTIQPVSGPFLSAAAQGIVFQYFDSVGGTIASGAADTRGIARIQIAFRMESTLPGKFAHAIGLRGTSVAAVALRNRPK